MKVVITDWAFQSYLDLKHAGVFTDHEYWSVLRPDVEKLKVYPNDPHFQNSNSWGPATDKSGNVIQHGHKMKWRQIGSGRVRVRLSVVIGVIPNEALLCRAYVKDSNATDKREAAKLKDHINKIINQQFTRQGEIP